MTDDAREMQRAQIDEITEQILDRAHGLAEHVLEHPGEFLIAHTVALELQEQLQMRRRLCRAFLIEVQG